MSRSTRRVTFVLACTVFFPALAFAQASITGNYVRTVNANYAAWLTPTAILDPRLFKISAQIDF